MPYYRYEGDRTFSDNANGREIDPGDEVELAERYASDHAEFVEVEENVEEPDEEEYTCGYNGCSRDVEEESARCWQHEDSEESDE